MSTAYEDDVIAWSERQAALLRARRWDLLDLETIAEEIEDVGKSEKRALQSRMAVLLAHLLKWKCQPGRRSHSWRNTIREQRAAILIDLKKCPSLKTLLTDPDWLEQTYHLAKARTYADTEQQELEDLPERLPWTVSDALSAGFLPE